MSKSSRKKKAEKSLASKMGMYTQFHGANPQSGHRYTIPGSKKIKG
jgi:hypothetical protein